ncbi:MAG: ABC transporter ATP-binding protein [Actinomycetota bacterium]|nr:ABC transporter ATP-binding protein [Actinomycetota bacterium]
MPSAEGFADCAVRVEGLSRWYRGRGDAVRANDNISFAVGRGEVFGLLGPNGAGKSTLVRQLAGVLAPDAGSIELLGHDVTRTPAHAPRLLAYLAQEEPALLELPVGLAVETTARLRGLSRSVARTLTGDLLDELSLTQLSTRALRSLSGGQRRLAELAAALVGDRPLLVLDEPTTGLDAGARRAVWEALRRRTAQGATIVLVTHNVLEAESVLDRVAVLDAGRIIACDTPGGLKALLGDDVRLDLVWRSTPPAGDPVVAQLAALAIVVGRRWSCRLPQAQARAALAALTGGAAFAALDDFTLATPSLEDVYLRLGGAADDLERR